MQLPWPTEAWLAFHGIIIEHPFLYVPLVSLALVAPHLLSGSDDFRRRILHVEYAIAILMVPFALLAMGLPLYGTEELVKRKTPYLIAYIVVGLTAVLVTNWWSNFWHDYIEKNCPKRASEYPPGRIPTIPVLIGLFERVIITTLIGWDVSGSASFIGAWIAIKTAGGWQTWSKGTIYGRATLFAGLLGNAMSILFALIAGLIIKRYG